MSFARIRKTGKKYVLGLGNLAESGESTESHGFDEVGWKSIGVISSELEQIWLKTEKVANGRDCRSCYEVSGSYRRCWCRYGGAR